MTKGVRLLPPHDPYTQIHDWNTIVDEMYHREVWKAVGGPGTVLTRGELAGTWRARLRGPKLTIAVKTFGALGDQDIKSLKDEAGQVAALRGAPAVEVGFETY